MTVCENLFFLNCIGFSLALSGPGSVGQETDVFSARTRAALIRFQEFHAESILAPLHLSKGTGIFGELSQRVAQHTNALMQ